MADFPDLEASRLRLIELSESRLADFYEYSVDPQFYQCLEFPPQQTETEVRAYWQKLRQRSQSDNAYYWFIEQKQPQKVIGSFGIHDIDWRKMSAEISYGLNPKFWGQGYFQEAVGAVLRYAFTVRKFHRICATTMEENRASVAGLQKVGFRLEGVLRDYYLDHKGRRHNACLLAILHHNYQN